MGIKNYTFKLSVYSGDCIYLLAGIKAACEKINTKAEIYIWLNRQWRPSVEGQVHPYGINEYALQMLKPLLESQPYVVLCKAWEGEEVACDLDELRTKTISTMPHGSIAHWHAQVWPDMHADVGRLWIDVDNLNVDNFQYVLWQDLYQQVKGKILINRTSRWRNDMIHYWFLREYKDQLIFAGLEEEHTDFCRAWELDIPLLKVQNFLELAIAIRSCKFMIGNQSLCFALAEAMKTPRVLEICPYAPNVIPVGGEAYQFLHQWAFEWLVKDLNERL